MDRRLRRAALLLSAVIGAAACSYWYTVDQSVSGPDLALTIEDPGKSFTIRACVTDAFAEDMAVTVIARARRAAVVPGATPLVALTVETPSEWEAPGRTEAEVGPTGTTRLVEGVRLDFDQLSVACSQGFVVTLERLDEDLAGTVEVAWDVYASAGSSSADIQDGELSIEVGP